ncbi:MAG: amidohydrolase family protein [Clostridia bacterium]|nr:amidohydrolase family protein [Clostridia bacterium]
MQNIIDAHTHIFHADLEGFTDPYVKIRYEAFGGIRFENGAYFQKMPLFIRDCNFDAEMLIKLMDANSVSRTIIMQNGSPLFMGDTVKAVKAYPERISGAMVLNMEGENCLDEIEQYARSGLCAIKFDMNDDMGIISAHRFPGLQMNGELIYKVLHAAQKYALTVVIDTGKPAGPGYQADAYREIISAFKSVHFVICHLGRPFYAMNNNEGLGREVERMWRLAEYSNVWFDVAALAEVIAVAEEYPHPSCARFCREFIDRFGANKLIWGSDAPGTLSDNTYKQLINIYDHSPLFTQREKDLMFYENAIVAYKL